MRCADLEVTATCTCPEFPWAVPRCSWRPDSTSPSNVRGIIADCGFTSPYDIFRHVLNLQFRLPSFPLMNLTELAVKRKAGFDYKAVSTPGCAENL